MFLCAVNATAAPNTSTAMQLLVEKGVLDKTIGVITVCDWAAAPQQKRLIRARLDQTGDAVALEPHGYVATMNAPVEGELSNLEKLQRQAMAEPGFFAAQGYQDKMDAGQMDLSHLRGRENVRFHALDIFSDDFGALLAREARGAQMACMVGTHLCGALSPRLLEVGLLGLLGV